MKKWKLHANELQGEIWIEAVDSKNDELIADLVMFENTGDVVPFNDAKQTLIDAGYDPYQYNHRFGKRGQLILK